MDHRFLKTRDPFRAIVRPLTLARFGVKLQGYCLGHWSVDVADTVGVGSSAKKIQ